MIHLRASSVGRVIACPPSIVPPAVSIEGDPYFADLGTATHVIATNAVAGKYTDQSEMDAIAKQHGVDLEELRMLAAMSKLCWAALEKHFPDPAVEDYSIFEDAENEISLTGHRDVFSVVDQQARVADFKTGYAIGDHRDQLTAYLFLAAQDNPDLDSFWGSTINVRNRELGEPVILTREELAEWYAGLVEAVTVRKDRFSPSHESCRYCPRRYECPARQTFLRSEIALLSDVNSGNLSAVANNDIRSAVVAAKHLKGICEQFLEAAKTEVLSRGTRRENLRAVGWDGIQVRSEDRREFTPEAWAPLITKLGMNRVQNAAKISVSKIEKEFMAMFAEMEEAGQIVKRQRGKLTSAEMESLRESGALVVNQNAVEKLEITQLSIKGDT